MNTGEAPVSEQDQPRSLDAVLSDAGVPRSLTPRQLDAARVCDLRLEGEEEAVTEVPPDGNPAEGQPGGGEEEFALDSFDPTQIPENASPEWLAERHQQMLGDYTKKTQETASERQEVQDFIAALQDPAQSPGILANLGWDVVGDEPEAAGNGAEEPYIDPDERMDQLEGALLADRQEREQAAQEEEVDLFVAAQLEEAEQKLERQFDQREVKFLSNYALSHPDGRGYPDVQGAVEMMDGLLSDGVKRWRESKRAPRKLSRGTPASPAVDLSDQKERRRVMAEEAQRLMDDSSS